MKKFIFRCLRSCEYWQLRLQVYTGGSVVDLCTANLPLAVLSSRPTFLPRQQQSFAARRGALPRPLRLHLPYIAPAYQACRTLGELTPRVHKIAAACKYYSVSFFFFLPFFLLPFGARNFAFSRCSGVRRAAIFVLSSRNEACNSF